MTEPPGFDAWAESSVDAEPETDSEDRSPGRGVLEEVPALDSAVSRETVALLDEELPRTPDPASAERGSPPVDSSAFCSSAAALGSKKKSTGRRPAPLLRRAAPMSARPEDRPPFFTERLEAVFFCDFSEALSVFAPLFAPPAEAAADAFLDADRPVVPRLPVFAPVFPFAPSELEVFAGALVEVAEGSAAEEPPSLVAAAADVSRETAGSFTRDRADGAAFDLPAAVRRRPA